MASHLQLIGENGAFNSQFEHAISALESGRRYLGLAIFGSQSTGKSTLLNDLFGTAFPTLPPGGARSQTTKGVCASITTADALGRGAAGGADDAGGPAGPRQAAPPYLLLFDCEGSDSRERFHSAEERMERQIACFAAAASDVLVINLWHTDIGRPSASNYHLFSIIFQFYFATLRASRPPGARLTMVFAVRDADAQTPEEEAALGALLTGDLVRIYRDTVGAGADAGVGAGSADADASLGAFEQHVDLRFWFLPHRKFARDAYDAKLAGLRDYLARSFVFPEAPLVVPPAASPERVPAPDLCAFLSNIWGVIARNDALDIPSQRSLIARMRCEAAYADALAAYQRAAADVQLTLDDYALRSISGGSGAAGASGARRRASVQVPGRAMAQSTTVLQQPALTPCVPGAYGAHSMYSTSSAPTESALSTLLKMAGSYSICKALGAGAADALRLYDAAAQFYASSVVAEWRAKLQDAIAASTRDLTATLTANASEVFSASLQLLVKQLSAHIAGTGALLREFLTTEAATHVYDELNEYYEAFADFFGGKAFTNTDTFSTIKRLLRLCGSLAHRVLTDAEYRDASPSGPAQGEFVRFLHKTLSSLAVCNPMLSENVLSGASSNGRGGAPMQSRGSLDYDLLSPHAQSVADASPDMELSAMGSSTQSGLATANVAVQIALLCDCLLCILVLYCLPLACLADSLDRIPPGADQEPRAYSPIQLAVLRYISAVNTAYADLHAVANGALTEAVSAYADVQAKEAASRLLRQMDHNVPASVSLHRQECFLLCMRLRMLFAQKLSGCLAIDRAGPPSGDTAHEPETCRVHRLALEGSKGLRHSAYASLLPTRFIAEAAAAIDGSILKALADACRAFMKQDADVALQDRFTRLFMFNPDGSIHAWKRAENAEERYGAASKEAEACFRTLVSMRVDAPAQAPGGCMAVAPWPPFVAQCEDMAPGDVFELPALQSALPIRSCSPDQAETILQRARNLWYEVFCSTKRDIGTLLGPAGPDTPLYVWLLLLFFARSDIAAVLRNRVALAAALVAGALYLYLYNRVDRRALQGAAGILAEACRTRNLALLGAVYAQVALALRRRPDE